MNKVVVLIPVKDTLYFYECLLSLKAQTFKDFLILVVNDTKSREAINICKEFSDLNIEIIHLKKNYGVGHARKEGLEFIYEKCSDISYVMFLDADDMLSPNAIEEAYYAAANSKSDIVLFDYYENNYLAEIDQSFTFEPGQIIFDKIIKIDFLKQNNINFLPLKVEEDLSFNLLLNNIDPSVFHYNKILYYHRYHIKSLTYEYMVNNDLMIEKQKNIINAFYQSFQDIKKKKQNIHINNCFAFIESCYDSYEILFNLNKIDLEIEKQIKYIFSLTEIQTLLKQFTSIILNDYNILPIKQFFYQNDEKLFWYKETFYQWCLKFGIDLNKK